MMDPKMINIQGGTYIVGVPEAPHSVLHKWEKSRKIKMETYSIADT